MNTPVKTLVSNPRLTAYEALLDELNIDPEDDTYSGGEDAAEFVSGEKPIERFCLVTQVGEWRYANASYATLDDARNAAAFDMEDDTFCEVPLRIVDLDTHQTVVPRIQWVKE